MIKHNDYCVILAGGLGQRLWPLSRRELPKQFLDLFGTGRTLLQQTYDRFSSFVPADRIYVSTFADYADLVLQQLPELDDSQALAEPVQLSTAPAVAWATFHIEQMDPEANIIVTPADQMVLNVENFRDDIVRGLEYVEEHADFLALAVKPTYPNTAYGYIQQGARQNGAQFRVKSFTEKPDIEVAKVFVESGEFLWNTGLFLFQVPTMARRLESLMPVMAENWRAEARILSRDEEQQLIERFYPVSLRMSVDMLILEQSENVSVQECTFGWSDVGTWAELHTQLPKDADGNSAIGGGTVVLSDCSNNCVYAPEGTAVCLQNLSGYVVALRNNVLVVCPDNDPQLVRKLFNEVRMKLGDEVS